MNLVVFNPLIYLASMDRFGCLHLLTLALLRLLKLSEVRDKLWAIDQMTNI